MKKEFIPYEQALALKELGFDEPCIGYYHNHVEFSFVKDLDRGNTTKNSEQNLYSTDCAAPTFSQAFRWFRKKYELFGEVIMYIPQDGPLNGCFTYISSVSSIENYDKNPIVDETYYKSHEEAELACLIKMIEIVKTK